MTAILDAAQEIKDKGRVDFLDRCLTMQDLTEIMQI
jgi:hypothetical protein